MVARGVLSTTHVSSQHSGEAERDARNGPQSPGAMGQEKRPGLTLVHAPSRR